MATINEILGKNIDSIKALKAEIKSLQDSLIGLDAESQEFKDTSYKLAAAQDELTKVTRAGKEENIAAKDSIVGMQQEYKKLYDTYKMLTDEQRNSDFGKNMAASLEELSTKLNETKQGVGNFKDNIGRYAGDITKAFGNMGISVGALQGPLKTATAGTKGLNASLKSLAANPIVLIATALVGILVKVADAIKNNEELTNRLKEAFSAFKPILDAISNAFNFLAGIVVKVVEGLAKVGEKILSIIPGYKEAAKSHKELAKATNELTKATREANVENSKKQAEIERLREEASATEDVAEKKRLLEEAKAMQAEVDQKNIEIAQEELRIMQEYASKTANSAEENERLAATQKKVNDAIAQGERNMRQYNKQIAAVEKSTKSAGSAGKNYREEAKKLYEQVIENNKDEITKITEKYEKEKKLLEKYHYDTTLLTKQYNKNIREINLNAAKTTYDNIRRGQEERLNIIKEKDPSLAIALQIEHLERRDLPALQKVRDKYTKILNSLFDNDLLESKRTPDWLYDGTWEAAWNEAASAMTEFEKTAKKEGFSKLGSKYKGLADMVEMLNAKLGLNIITIDDLENAIDSTTIKIEKLKKEFKEIEQTFKEIEQTKAGEEAIKRISDELSGLNLKMFKDAFSFDVDTTPFEELEMFVSAQEYTILEKQKETYEKELANFKGTNEQKLELMEQYYAILAELRDRDAALEQLDMERRLSIWDAAFDHFDAMTSSINSVADAIGNVMQAEIDSGKLTEEQAKRKKKALENLEKTQLAVAIAGIAANTAAGIMDVWRGYAAELPINAQTAAATGPGAVAVKAALDAKSRASAIIRTATLAVEGAAQIAAAIGGYVSKSKSSGESGDGASGIGVSATPTLIDSTPYEYYREAQMQSDIDEINNRQYFVSVVDIESGLNSRVKVTDESSF